MFLNRRLDILKRKHKHEWGWARRVFVWYKMKILMLGWELPPYNSGGLGVACYHLAKALAAEGADIDFILPPSAQYD